MKQLAHRHAQNVLVRVRVCLATGSGGGERTGWAPVGRAEAGIDCTVRPAASAAAASSSQGAPALLHRVPALFLYVRCCTKEWAGRGIDTVSSGVCAKLRAARTRRALAWFTRGAFLRVARRGAPFSCSKSKRDSFAVSLCLSALCGGDFHTLLCDDEVNGQIVRVIALAVRSRVTVTGDRSLATPLRRFLLQALLNVHHDASLASPARCFPS